MIKLSLEFDLLTSFHVSTR